MEEMKTCPSAGTMIGAFVGGMLFGGMTALLMAPQSGKDTQEQIRRNIRRKGEELHDLQQKTRESYYGILNSTSQYIEETQAIVKEALQAGREEIQKKREELTREAQNLDPQREPARAE